MGKSFQIRMVAITLAVFTLAACILAGLNISREGSFDAPTDGLYWSEVPEGLQALKVPDQSLAKWDGIRKNDILIAANAHPVHRLAQLERQMVAAGSWNRITYTILRDIPGKAGQKARVNVQVILEPTDRSVYQGLRLIALAYLSIGLYVLFRRWTAPKATHFYIFCLASFVSLAFKYTGQFDGLDWTFYWGSVIAGALQPALFLHFALSFGEQAGSTRRRVLAGLLYLPGLFLVGLQLFAIQYLSATEMLRHRLDQISIAYMALYYVASTLVLVARYKSTRQPLERQQLKWLARGALLSVIPFTLFYVVPYLTEMTVPQVVPKIATLMLVFLPLTFAWAIVRYRMMDTDLIFKRGVTYTLATAALVGVYFGIVALSAEVVHTRLPSLRIWGLLAAIIATALIFDPIKNAIQARVDRIFDRKRIDYRETLIEFSRSLSSETDLTALSQSIVDRLSQTLLVSRVAVFVTPQEGLLHEGFSIAASHGLSANSITQITQGIRHASFLNFRSSDELGHRFFENPQHILHLSEQDQETAALLDMSYYLPCRVAGRTSHGSRPIAVIGLGRTQDGDYLSSEDMELLESLAGYIGIAIQNAQLFHRLETKITEFERLKEFNENIVESIKVGIFTLDLEDHIESWNAEMEQLYSLPRVQAIGKHLAVVFPDAFVREFENAKSAAGTHHLSKIRMHTHSGDPRTANVAIAPLLTRDFIAVGRIVLLEDITERTELEAQLTQAEKLSSIGMLAAGVAHEVNTPLAVISSYTQMLTKQAKDDARLSLVLEKITQQTFRASEIVNGLLNFSRKTATEFSRVDLNAILHDTASLLEHHFRSARIQLDMQLAPNLPETEGSHGKLQQVALNLMLNAKDAMQDVATPLLTVRTSSSATHVFVSVQDNGSGIDTNHLHRIYDPFFTTKNAPREGQHKGTGLGLAVSYGIVQEHGGRIRVDSTVGVGTTFTLELPIVARTAGQHPAENTLHA